MSGHHRPSAREFQIACEGPVIAVRLSPNALEQYQYVLDGTDKLSVQRRKHLARYFHEFCTNNPHRLGQEKFKKEGDFSDGRGGYVAIWAFRVRQWRLYGAFLQVGNRRCFVGVRVDATKKQDKADQQMLRNAALDIAGLVEYGT